jgi:hypothetical protein
MTTTNEPPAKTLTAGQIEKIKLRATFLNGIALAIFASGALQLAFQHQFSGWFPIFEWLVLFILTGISIFFHWAATDHLSAIDKGEMPPEWHFPTIVRAIHWVRSRKNSTSPRPRDI